MSCSKCIYCSSTSFGKSCLFSPTQTHVHTSSSGCIYCGSSSIGMGSCHYNPYGNQHISGADFLNRSNIQAESLVLLKYLLEQLLSKNVNSPLDRFYTRVGSILTDAGNPFFEALALQESSNVNLLEREELLNYVNYKTNIKHLLSEFSSLIKQASLSMTPKNVEECLLDAILSFNED